jgi:glycosyltransferase involved in cell wall biosynthesis
MIRRLAGRVRRGLRARLVPLRDRLRESVHRSRGRLGAIRRTGVAVLIIASQLGRSAARRFQRGIGSSPRPLRIGVDIRPFYEPLTGVGWYLFNLLSELSRVPDLELVLFGDPMQTDSGPRLFVSIPGGLQPLGFDYRGYAVPPFGRRLASAAYALMAWMEGCDLFFGANYFLPRALSSVARRRVVTIHDLTYRRFPELLQGETLENLEREMLREVTRADAVICVSEATRADVLREYSVDPSRVVTIHSGLGIGPAKQTATAGLRRPYLLFVSTIEPRKNLDVLLTAFEKLREQGRYSGDLVIVGKMGWKAELTAARFKTSRWRDAIQYVDYVGRERLASIYQGADVFVLPSIYEGFGFPLLEAMAYGIPSIAARSSSLPEIGGDAVLYFDPRNSEELADAIERVTRDPVLRSSLARKASERAAAFRWDKTAEATVALFRKVAESA